MNPENKLGFTRPGVSAAMLIRNCVELLTAEVTHKLIGFLSACLRIPFCDLDGNPIADGGKPFYHYRLLEPIGDMKYYQAKGSISHGFLPVGLKELAGRWPWLLLTEGDFKSMAMVEAGYPTVGLTGINNIAVNDGKEMIAELKAAIALFQPQRIYFVGDNDTGHNYLFSSAAIKLRELVAPIPVFLPRFPWDSPDKGLDDLRESLKERFPSYLDERLRNAVPVDKDYTPGDLALVLLRNEIGAVANLADGAKAKVQHRLIKLAAYLQKYPLEQDEAVSLICDHLHVSRSAVRNGIKIERKAILDAVRNKNASKQSQTKNAGGPARKVIVELPSERFTHISKTAADVFPLFAKTGRFFRRGRVMCEVASEGKSYRLENVSAAGLRTRIEKLGALLMRYVLPHGTQQAILMQSNLHENEAKALMESEEAELLPPITGLAPCPVMAADSNGGFRVLAPGYDSQTGIYVASKARLPDLPAPEAACNRLLDLLVDFDFKTPSDKARAVSLMLTPALVLGRLTTHLTPLFMGEANDSQSGKGYLFDTVAAVYHQPISLVGQHSGHGVGSTDEGFHAALATGYPLIVLDNFRGKLDSRALELYLTNRQGSYSARLFREGFIRVNPAHFVLGLTSNGLELTRDQANRTILIRLQKRPEDYRFRLFPEGELLDHVRSNWLDYLAAVYAVIVEWARLGQPRSAVRYDSFSGWAQGMDWIVQNLFRLPPLLDGLKEEKLRVSNPALTFVRELGLALQRNDRLNQPLNAASLAATAELHTIKIPSLHQKGDLNAAARAIGITMGQLYKDGANTIEVDGLRVVREESITPRANGGGGFPTKVYTFALKENSGATPDPRSNPQ
jgi:hypothetical protein